MPRHHWVTRGQVMAARLVVKMEKEDGRESDPIIVKIANAKTVPRHKPTKVEPSPEDATANG